METHVMTRGRAQAARKTQSRYTPPTDVFERKDFEYLPGAAPSELTYAPPVLYMAGNVKFLDGVKVALVGSRDASDEGVRRAQKLSALLVREGITVVSGLAAGVDCAAHEAAIQTGGKTIAVIGTPLDKAYPAENAPLQELIYREHLLVSQFKPGERVFQSNFVRRNRTMAAIAQASVIIEAGDGSGTLSQAAETMRLNRPLFIMASALERADITWPKRFLAAGARVLNRVEDVIEGLGL
jgi:DNA processing protein